MRVMWSPASRAPKIWTRGFARELLRLGKPGGWIVTTTPNQATLASLLCLTMKREFEQFQTNGLDRHRAHITALLETDLIEIARKNSPLDVVAVQQFRRVPFSTRQWPPVFRDRWFSDNLMLAARKACAPEIDQDG